MDITITKDALRALLFGILSCHCPVTPEVEIELFNLYKDRPDTDTLDLAPYLAAADRNPARTPVHIFLEFCRYGHDDPNLFAIDLGDVIRYFCSRFHFNAAKAALDPVSMPAPASQLVGHLLLVATPAADGSWSASVGSRAIKLENLFLPGQIKARVGALYGMHFGMIITELTPAQAKIANDHLALIPELEILAGRIGIIDYADYQGFGNHHDQIAERYLRNF